MQPSDAFTIAGTSANRRPVFCILQGQIDLDQHVDRAPGLGGALIHSFQQVDAVDRVNRAGHPRGLSRLVRLQVADEMPPQSHIGRLCNFLQGFLDLVFAEVDLARVRRGPDGVDWVGLGDRDQPDVVRLSSGAAGRVRDACADFGQLSGNV